MIQKYTVLIILLLIFIFNGCNNSPSTKRDDISNQVIIKVSDFEVDVQRFKEYLENQKVDFNSKDKHANEKEALDYFLSFSILLAEAKRRGYDKDSEIERQLIEYKKSVLINSAQKQELYEQKITDRELQAAYKRSKIKLIVDHIWLKSNDISILNEILNYLKDKKSSIEEFLSLKNSISHELMTSVLIERKVLFGGSIISELEREAYKMKENEKKLIKTESGYHILNLIDSSPNLRGTYEKEKDNIRECLARAKIEDHGGYQIDKKMNNKIKIDTNILALMNFSVAPIIKRNNSVADNIIKDDETVVIFNGRKITVKELNSMIYQLPAYIKIYFNNNVTRLNEIIKLLKKNNVNEIDKKIEKEYEESYYYNKKFLNKIENLQIDFKVLNSMDFCDLYIQSCNEILAQRGKWIFTIGDLFREIKNLSQESIIKMKNRKDKYRFIKFIEGKNNYNSNDNDKLDINTGLLEKLNFNIISNTIELKPYEESDIVVSFDSTFISVEQLRRKVCQLPKWKIKKFLFSEDRINALKDMIAEEYWLNKAKCSGLEKDVNIIQKINEKKQWLMVQKLYKNEIFKTNIMFADEKFDTLFCLKIREISKQRLINVLQRLSKNVEIGIDKSLFKQLGISIDSISFLQDISDQLFDRVGIDFGVKINFQPDNVKVPSGYLKDSGALFSDRENGYMYGWDKDISQNTRYRKDSKIDPILSTLNFFHKYGDRVWELVVPNGKYIVSLVAGDPMNDDHINNLSIEGTIINDPDGMDNFDYYILPITVKDNRLTIKAFGAVKTRLCFIEIKNCPDLQ